jgi:hypothetical protein
VFRLLFIGDGRILRIAENKNCAILHNAEAAQRTGLTVFVCPEAVLRYLLVAVFFL